MIGVLPNATKHKMPPLTRRAATINYLVEPLRAVHSYKTQRDFCDDLLDANKRLWNFAIGGICLSGVGCFLAGLYCR